ncbi:hypothetical protein POVWA1_027310 [Plasmodium ovale wallikeri]|uniref:Uncharacterized protein n=1 Tax=Plasmodium ovale wallikeri TaxID=864142 RepID=A0A1A8YUT1_PLAOA|nr:hypothetical protein POVWA1_027310 [Plasmodium ovale wallikeri]
MHLQNYIIVLSRKRSGHFTCSALRPVNNVSTAQLSSGALRTSHVALPTGTYACLHTRTTQTTQNKRKVILPFLHLINARTLCEKRAKFHFPSPPALVILPELRRGANCGGLQLR